MNPLVLDKIELVCPSCRKPTQNGFKDYNLILDDVSLMDNGYVLEGTLCCSSSICGKTYPIYHGVPCIFRDDDAIQSALSSDKPHTPHISFLDAHYADFCQPQPRVNNRRFWKTIMGACAFQNAHKIESAIDLGCSTGRFTFQLADYCHTAVGLDLDFQAITYAAALQRGEKVHFQRPVRSMATEQVEISYQGPENVLFVCGDAIDPPFRASSFQFASAINLLDVITEPLILLRQINALIVSGGDLLILSPFAWKDTICNPDLWLENEDTPAPEMLKQILTGECFPDVGFNYTISSFIRDIPWYLPISNNHLSLYRTVLVKALKA